MHDITPMMKQYTELKTQIPGKLLFFRMGDFYELFEEDAKIAAPILGIALTSRDKKSNVPMCGVPYHAVSSYIHKLTNKGYSVAITEQVEDPKKAKGLVKRSIVKVVTPSLVYDSDTIDTKKTSYLMAIYENLKLEWSIAYIDYTTGEFKTSTLKNTDELLKEISSIAPKEIIFERKTQIPLVVNKLLQNICFTSLELDKNINIEKVMNSIVVDRRVNDDELKVSKLVLYYLQQTQFLELFPHIKTLSRVSASDHMSLDEFTINNLELINTLLPVIDQTITPMGGRFIRTTLLQPLINKEKIDYRLNIVDYFKDKYSYLKEYRNILRTISDIERLLAKLSTGSYRPLEFKKFLESIVTCYNLIEFSKVLPVKKIDLDISLLNFCVNTLMVLEEELPNTINESGIFKKGYYKELDEYIELHNDSRKFLYEMEKREREFTKINSLKIKFNKIFGYYIEISNSNLNLVPSNYLRKQTLVNGERFTTEELSSLEVKLLSAEEKRKELEKAIIEELCSEVKNKFVDTVIKISNFVSELDMLQSFAWQAVEKNYTRPEISENFNLLIKDARHPVMETIISDDFIPNDIDINQDKFFHIITGPNMAGKSTVMRSVALIVIMAHIGSFVPATSASIPITDKVFTRVGATDYILKGQSTFMVEMIETANIINSATKNSLIILDEIGRGTSTYDGISIAWAISEHIHNNLTSKTMFATHYHELTDLENTLSGVKNYSMAVHEQEEGLFFIRKLVAKPASSSYGIQVAEMAGIPKQVIERASSLMNKFNLQRKDNILNSENIETKQLYLFDAKKDKKSILMKELNSLNLNKITPIEALNRIYEWKKQIEADSET